MQKGALKIFDPCTEDLEKKYHKFLSKIEFTCFSMGLTRYFHGKKGPEFFKVGAKIFMIRFFCISPPPYKRL